MAGQPLIDVAWLAGHLDGLLARTLEHLWLAAISVMAGFVISFAIALWIRRDGRVHAPATAIAGILYTIPSLALFAALVPITGLSMLTAVIPLTIYTILILVRGISAGFASVPPDVVEAADGMGYASLQRLWAVELPLALPLILAGLRLAAVSTIGLVTIGTQIGDAFGGLGLLIKEGIQTFFPTKIYAGAILSILLAVAVDLVILAVQRLTTPWARVRAEAR